MDAKTTTTDLIMCSVSLVAFMGLCAVDRIVNGPTPKKAPPMYTTSDGNHHGCTLAVSTGLISNTTWTLTCPDGYVQHNGNYTLENP